MSRPDVVNDFEAWAAVSAQLYDRDEAASLAILEELEIGALWENADAGWAKALAADMAEMRLDRIEQLTVIYARELASRRGAAGDDFRHELAQPATSEREAKRQIGGTPFSSDPDDHAPTHKLLLKDLQAHLDATQWPLQKYAQYRAELEAAQESDEAIHARYALTRQSGSALQESWERRLDANDDERNAFEALVTKLKAQLVATRSLPT